MGTDSRTSWGLAFSVLAAGSVAAAAVWRVLRSRTDSLSLRLWPGAAAFTAAELVVALAIGLHHGG